MIKIDFFWAIAVYIFLMISLVIGHWIFYTSRKEKDVFNDTKFFQECPYCTYMFFNEEEGDRKMCPKCHSYMNIKDNQSGLVLVSVLAISIMMIIVAVSILNSNVNLTLSGQRQIDRIKAEQIAKGQFWRNYDSLLTMDTPTTPLSVTLTESHPTQNGGMVTFSKTFSATATPSAVPGPNQTTRYDVSVSY